MNAGFEHGFSVIWSDLYTNCTTTITLTTDNISWKLWPLGFTSPINLSHSMYILHCPRGYFKSQNSVPKPPLCHKLSSGNFITLSIDEVPHTDRQLLFWAKWFSCSLIAAMAWWRKNCRKLEKTDFLTETWKKWMILHFLESSKQQNYCPPHFVLPISKNWNGLWLGLLLAT